jgi:glycosyltransferase involved in cell wall biosynthesis
MTEVSVVIPVYNRPYLVVEAISSIQRQSDVDVEILVVDDGSTDRTVEVVRRLSEADKRVRLICSKHSGPAAARNIGVAAARGDFLTFLDSDDLCPKGRIRRQIDKLESRFEVFAVVGAILGFDALDAAGEPVPAPVHIPYHNAALHSATFRTQEFRSFGPLDEALAFAEDVDFFLRLLEANVRLILEREVASYYRFHRTNMVRDLHARQQGYLQAYARSIRRRREMCLKAPLRGFFAQVFKHEVEIGGSIEDPLQLVKNPQ